jgi:predicted nucleic acid-binding protein
VATVSWYLDASVLVALLTVEPFSGRADASVLTHPDPLLVSDFAEAEFASAIARRVRTRESTLSDAQRDLSDFDIWVGRSAHRVEMSPADVATATTFLRRLDLTLRTPDALHIAIAQRVGATLVTFDTRMADSARALGVAVALPCKTWLDMSRAEPIAAGRELHVVSMVWKRGISSRFTRYAGRQALLKQIVK